MSMEDRWARFWKLWGSGGWEPWTRAELERTLRPGDLFVDLGAWIGPVSLWALELGAKVIAIEPDPKALEELHRRVPAEVEIWEGAVAPWTGRITIAPRHAFGDSMTSVADDGLSVPCWTLHEILAGRVPSLVVMDIEGYELTLLPKLAPYLASLGTSLMVALHTALPDRAWFSAYSYVSMPKTPRRGGPAGRSLSMVARP